MTKIQRSLICCLPVCVFFSAWPSLTFGSSNSMNFELSLIEIWLVTFFIFSFPILKKIPRKHFFAISVFPFFATISLIWTSNPIRGVLTVGVLWLVSVDSLIIFRLIRKISHVQRLKILKNYLCITSVICLFCIAQCLFDALGLDRQFTLLCQGCTYQSFGFSHPNGFTLEPQFMGNLLIFPALTSLYLLFSPKRPFSRRFLFSVTSLLIFTLFLTFSRGAIYAFLLSSVFLVALSVRKNRLSLLTFPIIIVLFVFSLCFQGFLAQISPTSDNFITGAAKSLHHLSLGHIDLRPTPEETTDSETPKFTGYVSESTSIRTSLTGLALSVWKSAPVIGTGIGSAGTVLFQNYPELGTSKEIVQNQYVSILLELGIIGAICLIISVIAQLKNRKLTPVFVAYSVATAATLFFFSGLPNALHVYLLPPLFLPILEDFAQPSVRRSRRHQKH